MSGHADAPVGKRTPNPVRRARTRTVILDAAESQFVERGFAATTIDRLVPLTDVSKGAVYFHFGSKDDLLVALIDRSRESVFEPGLSLLRDPDASPTAQIVGYFNRIGSLEQLNRYLLPVLVSVQGVGVPPEARERIEDLQTRVRDSLVATITAGQSSGEFTSPLRPPELAGITMALMDGMLLQWHRHTGAIRGPEFLRAGRHALLGGLGAVSQHPSR